MRQLSVVFVFLLLLGSAFATAKPAKGQNPFSTLDECINSTSRSIGAGSKEACCNFYFSGDPACENSGTNFPAPPDINVYQGTIPAALPSGSGDMPGAVSPPSSGAGSPAGGPAGSSFACPAGTTNINGLCVPDSPSGQAGQGGFASADTLPELAVKILQFLLTLAGVIAVLAIIIGGYWYLTAAGNEEQSEKGKKALIQSIIGLVVIVLAYTIVMLIIRTVTEETVF